MTIQTISPKQAHEWVISGEALLIDVREPDEFKEEHIAYGLSIPLSIFEREFESLNIPASQKLIFHCLRGGRGEKACLLVQNLKDIQNPIFNIEGGITKWKEDALPTISLTSQGTKISIFRQVQMIVGGLIFFLLLLSMTGIGATIILAAILAAALFFAGLTGWCGLAMLLQKMPWNK